LPATESVQKLVTVPRRETFDRPLSGKAKKGIKSWLLDL